MDIHRISLIIDAFEGHFRDIWKESGADEEAMGIKTNTAKSEHDRLQRKSGNFSVMKKL